MAVVRKVTDAGKRAGKAVLATDAAQSLVGTVVDKLERVVKEQTDDVGEQVKKKAAKAGGRRTPKTTRKSTGRKKTAARKPTSRKTRKPARRKSTAKKTTARKPAARKKTTSRTKASARKPATRKTSARKSR